MKGYIHSYETFGTKDGPGIRFVVFMQGCPLRCIYCHNPDTWKINSSKYELAPADVFSEIVNMKPFIKNGGVTVSGGEPLLQTDFIYELFSLCKKENIHTAIDTSGYIINDSVKKLLNITDLVLLDVKHIDPEKYKKITSKPLEPTLKFINYLSEINKPVWVRYVLVPSLSDDESDLHQWGGYISQYKNVEKIEILPFHQMGLHKWRQLGEDYKLKEVKSPSQEEIKKAEEIFSSYGLKI